MQEESSKPDQTKAKTTSMSTEISIHDLKAPATKTAQEPPIFTADNKISSLKPDTYGPSSPDPSLMTNQRKRSRGEDMDNLCTSKIRSITPSTPMENFSPSSLKVLLDDRPNCTPTDDQQFDMFLETVVCKSPLEPKLKRTPSKKETSADTSIARRQATIEDALLCASACNVVNPSPRSKSAQCAEQVEVDASSTNSITV